MRVLFTLHVVAAVFVIGPLVGAVTSVLRANRTDDSGLARLAARSVRIYGWATLLVAVLGVGLVRDGFTFTDGWILGSMILYVAAFGLTTFVLAPAVGRTSSTRVPAVAGTVLVLYLAIVVLMAYQP